MTPSPAGTPVLAPCGSTFQWAVLITCQIPIRFGWPSGVRGALNVGAGVCASIGNIAAQRIPAAIIESQNKDLFFIQKVLKVSSQLLLSDRGFISGAAVLPEPH